MLRRGDTLVVRWVDRLGRNYQDVCDTIRELMRKGVVVRTVINNMTFDGATKDPMQQAVRDALIAFMAATASPRAFFCWAESIWRGFSRVDSMTETTSKA